MNGFIPSDRRQRARCPGAGVPRFCGRLAPQWVDKRIPVGILMAWVRLFTLSGAAAVTPLEQLFALEVEFYRRLRMDAGNTVDASSPHTSYALQAGYEGLIPAVGKVSARDIDVLRERLVLRGDPRDVLKARDSVMRILGIIDSGR